jgi:polar amino acid transport system substrate-binding protein
MPRLQRLLALAVPLLVTVAACGGSATASSSPLSTSAASVAAPSTVAAPSVAAPSVAAPSPDACTKDALKTVNAGKLTIGTENPAFPPYYGPATAKPSDSTWEVGDPRTGEGFEAATAYAVAEKLGFTKDEVVWVAMPFTKAAGPGPKPFDYYLRQITNSPDLSQAVDLSTGYFEVRQAVVALKDNAIAKVSSVAGLTPFKLGGTNGANYYYIDVLIQLAHKAVKVDTLDAGVSALKAKRIDGLVVDLPSAYRVRDVLLTNAVILGALPSIDQEVDILLPKPNAGVYGLPGNPLTVCVNHAIDALKSDGTLKQITDKWIPSEAVPELK